jgi:hypothetical protein
MATTAPLKARNNPPAERTATPPVQTPTGLDGKTPDAGVNPALHRADTPDMTAAVAVERPARTTRTLPKNHPARVIGTHNDDDEYTFLDVEVTGGWVDPAHPTLTHWTADISVTGPDDSMSVATMSLTVVDPTVGLPAAELADLDEDAEELGEALFFGQARTTAFNAIAPNDGLPVLLINTYDVDDDWRGTALTPVMALRVLKVFAGLGIRTAALHAAPIAEDMTPAERTRIGVKIEKMWSQVGFINLDTHSGFMAMPFNRATVTETLTALAGKNTTLRAAADIW